MPPGGEVASVTFAGRVTLAIRGDASIALDNYIPNGYYVRCENPFGDVSESDWFYNFVIFAYTHNLMNGTCASPMLFSPHMPVTRGMVATVLYNLEGKPDAGGLPNPFADADEGAWYADAVKWAAANGIAVGVGGGRYAPDDVVARQDMATILMNYARFAGLSLPAACDYPGFGDGGSIADYAKEPVEQLYRAGVVNGKLTNNFDPAGRATRAELAVLLQKFLEAVARA